MLAADLPERHSYVDAATASSKTSASEEFTNVVEQFHKLGLAPLSQLDSGADFPLPVESPSMLSTPFDQADAEFVALLPSSATTASPVDELDLMFDTCVDEVELASRDDIPLDKRKERLQRILSRAASNGDDKRVERILNEVPREYIDLNAADEEGYAPLNYAACFGHMEIAFLLLEAGADPDVQDKFGWTPLTWATKNNHYAFARMLVDYGAKASTKTAGGRTAMDFARHFDVNITELFSASLPESFPPRDRSSFDQLEFYSSGGVDVEAFQSERDFMFRMAMERATGFENGLQELAAEDTGDDSDVVKDADGNEVFSDSDAPFDWDQCLPDQMFVYDPTNLHQFLDAAIGGIKPRRSAGQKPIPANVLFLSARYAHYFCNNEMVNALFTSAVAKIRQLVNSAKDDLAVFAFWLANTTFLLYYIHRDKGLHTVTFAHQGRLSELITDIYLLLAREVEARLYRILDASIVEYEPIPGLMDGVRFERARRSLFGIGLSRPESPPATSVTAGLAGMAVESSKGRLRYLRDSALFRRPLADDKLLRTPSPKTVTTLFSSILFLLRVYHVHPYLIQNILSQMFYYMAVVLFNRVLTTHALRCRSRAVQIRMNVSALEDWGRANRIPAATLAHLTPVVELLQFLQCLTQLSDLATFLETRAKLQAITPMQLRKIVEGYRYEVGEQKVPEEVRQYVIQVAEDTAKAEMERVSEEQRREPAAQEQPAGSPGDSKNGGVWEEIERTEEARTSDTENTNGDPSDDPNGVASVNCDAATMCTDVLADVDHARHEFTCGKLSSGSYVAVERDRHVPKPLDLDCAGALFPRSQKALATDSTSPSPRPSGDLTFPDSPLQEVKDADYLLPFTIPCGCDFVEGWRSTVRRRTDVGGRERVPWFENPIIPTDVLDILDGREPPRKSGDE